MARRGWNGTAKHGVWLAFALVVAVPAEAQAQLVGGCQSNQFLDRTAANADRELNWDFGITGDPERCLQVRTGQTVSWSGDLDVHPLAGQGGDMPNPISLHQNGSVTFTAPGTYGFVCLSHSSMRGAIRVVAAPAAAVPALSPWLAVVVPFLLLAAGWMAIRRQSTIAAMR